MQVEISGFLCEILYYLLYNALCFVYIAQIFLLFLGRIAM